MNKFSHRDIQDIHDLNNIPIVSIDSNGLITYGNSSALRLLSIEKADLGKRNLYPFLKKTHSGELFYQTLLTGIPVTNELANILADGDEYHIAFSSHLIEDVDGISLIYLFFQSITSLEKGENLFAAQELKFEKLLIESKERQARLAAIVNTSDDAIVSKNLQGIIASWNHAASIMFGYTEAEALGKHISLIIPPERLQEEELIINKIKNSERIEHFETMRLRKDGKQISVSLSISPIIDETGKIIGASKIARDISRQKEFEEKLQRYTSHVETLNTMSKLVSESLEINEILQRVIDASVKIIGAGFGIFSYQSRDSTQEQQVQFAYAGQIEDFEKSFRRTVADDFLNSLDLESHLKDLAGGGMNIESFLSIPVISKSGDVVGQLVFGHEDENRFNEDHEKLLVGIATLANTALENATLYEEIRSLNAKKDEFIGLASHELKTPITSLKGFLQFISMRMVEGDSNKVIINKALQQTNRLSSLVGDMLDVARIETGHLPLSRSSFDVVEMVKEAIEQIQYAASSHLITFHSEKPMYRISGDRQRLEQVVINLLNNAIKYSPEANLVKVCVLEQESCCVLQVQDFGMGISPEQQGHIFSRFYRAADITSNISGFGIGLYISKDIVDQHQGELSVQSEIGKGALFRVRIPH
ncbi:PAS domain S-box protein [Sphingobacterium sp.]|uniref:PAS domain S-box protein n=1 Tax=Sphingobacterium sp. TaxID=341027 RepID=UPI00289E3B38|nr:PAS domain S-box protein [Sphingobacterium sp.]